jgi:hypothetical protein
LVLLGFALVSVGVFLARRHVRSEEREADARELSRAREHYLVQVSRVIRLAQADCGLRLRAYVEYECNTMMTSVVSSMREALVERQRQYGPDQMQARRLFDKAGQGLETCRRSLQENIAALETAVSTEWSRAGLRFAAALQRLNIGV